MRVGMGIVFQDSPDRRPDGEARAGLPTAAEAAARQA